MGELADTITFRDWATRARAIDESFGQAVTLLKTAIDADGAMSARDKVVLGVAVTAVKDRDSVPDVVQTALERGISTVEIQGLALALYLSRGNQPCHAVLDALEGSSNNSSPGVVDQADLGMTDAISREVILDEFAAAFGTVPDRVTLLARHSPSGLEAYHRMRVAVLKHGQLPPMLAELMLFCVNAADHRSDFAAVHAGGARRLGATEAQLVEAGLCAVPGGGVAAWLAASEAIIGTRDGAKASQQPPPEVH